MIKTKKIIILGGQGDGLVVASFIKDIELYNNSMKLIGFLNDSNESKILEYSILGNLLDWKKFNDEDTYFITALLKVKYSYQRSNLIDSLNIPDSKYCNVIHPTATISMYSKIGIGNVIGPNVNIMPNVEIGNHCSFRAGSSIGHDCVIDSFCYLGPNSTMSGKSKLEKGAHIGPNSSVLDGKIIKKHSVLGIGSVATKDIESYNVCFGIPAKKIAVIAKD